MKKLFLAMICTLSLSVFTMSAANPSCQVAGKSVAYAGYSLTSDKTANINVSNSSSEYVNVSLTLNVYFDRKEGNRTVSVNDRDFTVSGVVKPHETTSLQLNNFRNGDYSVVKITNIECKSISGDCR